MKFRMLTATQISGGKCGLGSFVVIYSLSQSMQIVAIQCDSMTQISQIHDPDLQFVKRHQAVGLFCTCDKSLEILGPLNGGISQSHHGEGALLEGCLLKHWIQDGIKALFHVFQKNRCSKLDAVLQISDVRHVQTKSLHQNHAACTHESQDKPLQ